MMLCSSAAVAKPLHAYRYSYISRERTKPFHVRKYRCHPKRSLEMEMVFLTDRAVEFQEFIEESTIRHLDLDLLLTPINYVKCAGGSQGPFGRQPSLVSVLDFTACVRTHTLRMPFPSLPERISFHFEGKRKVLKRAERRDIYNLSERCRNCLGGTLLGAHRHCGAVQWAIPNSAH